MTIIYTDDSGPLTLTELDSHDPNSQKYYYLHYKPDTRSPSKEYTKGVDIIIPAVSNGCMYECVSGGISALVEPIFETVAGKITIDNTVQWKTKPLVTRLLTGDVITSSTWASDVGVTTTSGVILNDIATGIKVTSVPATAKSFKLTNTITIQRASLRVETFDKSIIVPILNL